MDKFFFFGTLVHLPLLEIVLGRHVDQADIYETHLEGYQAFWVKNQAFPAGC